MDTTRDMSLEEFTLWSCGFLSIDPPGPNRCRRMTVVLDAAFHNRVFGHGDHGKNILPRGDNKTIEETG